MNVSFSVLNTELEKLGKPKINTIRYYESLFNEELSYKCTESLNISFKDVFYESLKSNNIYLIKAVRNYYSNISLNINLKNFFDEYLESFNVLKLTQNEEQLDTILLYVFSDLINSEEDYRIEQATDFQSNPFLINTMCSKKLLEALINKFGEDKFFEHLMFKKLGPEKFIDFFMIGTQAEVAERCLNLSEVSPKVFNKVRDYFKVEKKWNPDNVSDSLLLHFLMDRDIEEKNMRKDVEDIRQEQKVQKNKLKKF